MKKSLLWVASLWDMLPTEIKGFVYATVAGLLMLLAKDLGEWNIENRYVLVVSVGVINALLVLAKRITKKATKFEEMKK